MAAAPGKQGIRWYSDTLTPHMTLFTVAAQVGLAAYFEEMAKQVEEYAKANAPWEDRSGDARAGLTAEARHRLLYNYIDLYHTVDYGIWLEIRWDGRYAIIEPTLEHFGPEVMAGLSWKTALHYG
jgi:hypothetical protein